MRKIEVVLSDERLITPSGLTTVGMIFGKTELVKRAARMKTDKRSQPQIKNGDILLSMIGLLTLGKTDYEDINEFFKDEEYYKTALGIVYGIPSESTLRTRLDAMGEMGREMTDRILQENLEMFKACKVKPTAMRNGYVPVDIDVTPMDNSGSHKEGVSYTYKGFMGYAPIVAYIGTEGYICDIELREGKQHCQQGTPEFLEEVISSAKEMTDRPLLFRMDSGNDALDNITRLHWEDEKIKFIIKRNLRRESREEWVNYLKPLCKNIKNPREGKTVYTGSTFKNYTDEKLGEITVRVVYEIIERTITADGQILLAPDVEINMFMTSLGCSDEEVIELYHNHGLSEQFHSELKSDMGVERLPSGKFATNALILKLAMLAYNVLRIIGTEAMKKDDTPVRHKSIKRRRLKTVIENLMLIAGHLTCHARKLVLALGRSSPWADAFIRIFDSIAAV